MIRIALLLLLLPCLLHAQEVRTVSSMPSPDQVATAKATIKSAETSPTLLAFGGYALVEIKIEGELTPYIVPGSDDCLRTIKLAKGQAYEGWLVTQGETAFKWVSLPANKDHDRLLVTGTANGTATIIWMTVQNGKAVVVSAFQFVVGKPKPQPPGPGPDDVRPPIPTQGLRVLFVYETKDLSKLPSAQVQMLTAKTVLDYLDSHCAKDNGAPEYRKIDPNADTSRMSEVWKQAMARPRSTLPWLLISNGKDGYEGVWPENTDELLKLLKKYGGE